MRCPRLAFGPFLFAMSIFVGCGRDDDPVAAEGGSGSGTDHGEEGNESEAGESESTGDPSSAACREDADCDEGNACTVSACSEGTCQSAAAVISDACRPHIAIEHPPRAATLQGDEPIVEVRGTVTSKAGPITDLTVNGETVAVAEDGSFHHTIAPDFGGNVLVVETTDAFEQTRRRVQSFLWSNAYKKPLAAPEAMVETGLGIYLDQETIDDDMRGQPLDDLGSLVDVAFANLDLSQFAASEEPVTHASGYDIYLTGLEAASHAMRLQAVDGGVFVYAVLYDIVGDLDFDCTNFGCQLAGGSGTGGLSIEEVILHATATITVDEDHQLVITMQDVTTTVDEDGVEIWSNNGWTNFLITIARPFIMSSVIDDIENGLDTQISTVMGPALAEALTALAFERTVPFPNLADASQPIGVQLTTAFADTDFHDGLSPPNPSPPRGGAILLDAGAYPVADLAPYDNLGVPDRSGCGRGTAPPSFLRAAPLELALSDDLLNQMLHGAWRGGLLEFPFGGGKGAPAGIDVRVSGMLAPTASDCNDAGRLLAFIGDLRLDANIDLGTPITFVAYATMTMGLELGTADGSIGVQLTGIEDIWTELDVEGDDAISLEPQLIELIEAQIGNALLDALGGGSLGGIALPEIDLSERLGLPPGGAVLSLELTSSTRLDGATLFSGRL